MIFFRFDEKKQPFDILLEGSYLRVGLVLSGVSSTYPIGTHRMAQLRYRIKKSGIGQGLSFSFLPRWSPIVLISLQWYRVITTVSAFFEFDSHDLSYLGLSTVLYRVFLFSTLLRGKYGY